jgi:hypothetical protein
MIRKAPSPVPFEGGLECRPEGRAAPALVIEPTGAVLHRHALHHRELIGAAMRELADQELGVLSPGLQLRCRGAVRAIQRPCAPITVYFFPTDDLMRDNDALVSVLLSDMIAARATNSGV